MRKQVKQLVRECLVCQKCKPDVSAYPGLLQPIPIPKIIWSQISMDFIEGIPKSQGKNVVMVVVDRLSKYVHFIGLSYPFTAAYITQVFLDSVYKLHGLPESIVSDRAKVFISDLWKELFKVLKVKVGQVAYKLKPPAQAQIHNVFHISQLRKYIGPPVPMDSVMLPQCDKEGTLLKLPLKLLDIRTAKKGNRAVVCGLV
nr:retrotransposon-related protein [Tanacetum cinerariifolium]